MMKQFYKETKSRDAPARKVTRSTKPKDEDEPTPNRGVHGEAAVNDLDLSEDERCLRTFDLATRYGPCAGISRLERWERADKFGLAPPQRVREILSALGPDHPLNHCIWHGRV